MICIPDDPKFKSLIWEMVLCFRAHQVPSEAFSEDMRATHPAGMILVMHHVQELDKAIAAVLKRACSSIMKCMSTCAGRVSHGRAGFASTIPDCLEKDCCLNTPLRDIFSFWNE